MSFIIKKGEDYISFLTYILYDSETTERFKVSVFRNYNNVTYIFYCNDCGRPDCIHVSAIIKMIKEGGNPELYNSMKQEILNRLLR